MACTSAVVDVVEETKNAEEQVDEVEVKRDGSHDELVWRELVVDKVGIIHDISTKQETASDGEYKVHGSTKRNEDADEAGHYQGNEGAEKEGSHSREVILRLESEQREPKEYAEGDQQCL